MSDKQSFRTIFEGIVGKENAEKVATAFRGWKEKFNLDPAAVETPAPAALAEPTVVDTVDGKKLSIEGGMSEGATIMDVSGESPAPFEGTAELADGTTITAVAGKITAIAKTPAEPAEPASGMPGMDMSKFKAEYTAFEKTILEKFKAAEAKNVELANELADHRKALNEITTFMAQILETPVKDVESTPAQKFGGYASEQEWKEKDYFSYYQYRKTNG